MAKYYILDTGAAGNLIKIGGVDALNTLFAGGKKVIITDQVIGEIEKFTPAWAVFEPWYDANKDIHITTPPMDVDAKPGSDDQRKYNPTEKERQLGDISIKKFLAEQSDAGSYLRV